MSTNLYWEPADREKKGLPDALKYALRRRAGDGMVLDTMTESDIGYLEGLRDAGIEGAQELIDAIRKHGRVIVSEE